MASTQIKPYVNKKTQRNNSQTKKQSEPLFTNYNQINEAKTARSKNRSPFGEPRNHFQTDFLSYEITDI